MEQGGYIARRALGLVLAALMLVAEQATAGLPGELGELEQRLMTAHYRADGAALEAGRQQALGLAGAGDSGFFAGYLAAWASYRLAEVHQSDRNRARDLLNTCIDELTALVEGRSGAMAAEGHALLATCYGNSAAYYRPPRVIMRGTRSQRSLDQALALAPDNPRVILQDALSDYSRPAVFGGDVDRAAMKLERAVELFGAGQVAGGLSWGEADAWLFLAKIRAAAGDGSGARSAAERALALAPGYKKVEEVLEKL
jgi:hypothetical protein